MVGGRAKRGEKDFEENMVEMMTFFMMPGIPGMPTMDFGGKSKKKSKSNK